MVPRRPNGKERVALVVLFALAAIVAVYAWDAAQVGLVGVRPGGETGWDRLLPFLSFFVVLTAAIRHLIRRPERRTLDAQDSAYDPGYSHHVG